MPEAQCNIVGFKMDSGMKRGLIRRASIKWIEGKGISFAPRRLRFYFCAYKTDTVSVSCDSSAFDPPMTLK